MATRIIPGTLREVWQETTPLDGGAVQVIPTSIVVGPAAASGLARLLATLYATPVAGTPAIAATVARVNGRAVVTVTNTAAPGNTATLVLDITKLQSPQQGTGGAVGIVHVVATPSNGAGFIMAPTDVNVALYPVASGDQLLSVRRTASGICEIEMPAIATVPPGRILVIKDTGYNAAVNNITVTPSGADTINNIAAPYIIMLSGTALWLSANAVAGDWGII